MRLIRTLADGPRRWRGEGVNHEQERFRGDLVVEPLPGGGAVLLRYRATLDDGTVVHEECTLLAPGPDGQACLWPVMSELDRVLPHAVVDGVDDGRRAVFAWGSRDDATIFREAITVAFEADGALVYAHAWGLPGGAFDDRSSCRLQPVGDGAGAGGPSGGRP